VILSNLIHPRIGSYHLNINDIMVLFPHPELEENKYEERKKGLCFICKKSGHMSFNWPNKIKPNGFNKSFLNKIF